MDTRADATRSLAALRANIEAAEQMWQKAEAEEQRLRATVAELERRVDRLERILASVWEALP
jgi:septal ring factor EnvC (AmiA/AmiB activator)